jgi:hypothetical protein
MIIFLSIILLLSFTVNFYSLRRMCELFKIKKGYLFWFAVCLCAVSLVGASILRSHFDNLVSRILYALSADWFGILWLLFCTLIVYEILNIFFHFNPKKGGTAVLIIVSSLSLYSMINAQIIRVKELAIPADTNLKIVQISDIHLGSVGGGFLQRVIDKTNSLGPDLVVITGDIADNSGVKTQGAIEKLKQLKAKTFFVTGNHDMYAGVDTIIESLAKANVKTLRNQIIDFNSIQIIGIDETTSLLDLNFTVAALSRDPNKFSIMLSHRPVPPGRLAEMKINLALSGHTHNGQIFPFNFIVGLTYKYMTGLYKHDDSLLYVSPGTGTWGPRMRLGSSSEITLIKLHK